MSPRADADADTATVSASIAGTGERTINALRVVSVTEATSYLALLVATVVERTGGSDVGVSVLGPIHGVLYLVFAALVLVDPGCPRLVDPTGRARPDHRIIAVRRVLDRPGLAGAQADESRRQTPEC